jgi:hypothetical protein
MLSTLDSTHTWQYNLVEAQRTDGVFAFSLATAFPPRRVFGPADMDLTLQDAGVYMGLRLL